mmetsp:Transcript_15861/g.36280  ORF Transcript_15861/g.36280 Transcript_15861/m.36280 type:complete len:80 (+) Transcript_15861:859-1098(+)
MELLWAGAHVLYASRTAVAPIFSSAFPYFHLPFCLAFFLTLKLTCAVHGHAWVAQTQDGHPGDWLISLLAAASLFLLLE